jgi:uncharacterized protein (DUF983 family)
MSAEQPLVRPSLITMVARGALRRCPWCGDRKAYFVGWFAKTDACRHCGLTWRRGDVGFELGAVTVTTIVTFGAVVIGVGAGLILTAPNFAVTQIIVGLVAVAVVLPVLIYPSSYTIWQALDLAMRPPQAKDWNTASPQ